jgi:hypothetical protein
MKNFEELAGGLQRSLARGIGSIAASYQCYLARANALAVAQARTAEEIQFVANWMATFAYLLWYAIGATNELTHLVVPASFEDLYIEQPVRRGNNGVLVLRFSGWCRPGFDMEVKSLRYILNIEMGNLCARYGLPRIRVHVQRREHNRVLFALVFAEDEASAREKKVNVEKIKI